MRNGGKVTVQLAVIRRELSLLWGEYCQGKPLNELLPHVTEAHLSLAQIAELLRDDVGE